MPLREGKCYLFHIDKERPYLPKPWEKREGREGERGREGREGGLGRE